MFAAERIELIKKRLITNKRVEINELAKELSTSVHTIRRDLSALEQEGILKRTHGGAVLTNKVSKTTIIPSVRYSNPSKEQVEIGKRGAVYIHAGDTIFIGGSSTEHQLLHFITDIPDITVVTNSLENSIFLRDVGTIKSYLIGSEITGSGNFFDSHALDQVCKMNFDIAFIVGSGLNADNGLTTSNPQAALLQQKVMEQADKNICLAPNYKVGIKAFYQVSKIEDFKLIICDSRSRESDLQKIRAKNVELDIVEV